MLYGNHYGLSESPFDEQSPPPAPPPSIPSPERLQGLQPHTLTSLGSFGQADEVAVGVQKAIAKGKVREVFTSDTKPITIQTMTFDEFKKEFLKAWYAKWWVWAIAGGVVVAGGGTYWYLRRRR